MVHKSTSHFLKMIVINPKKFLLLRNILFFLHMSSGRIGLAQDVNMISREQKEAI